MTVGADVRVVEAAGGPVRNATPRVPVAISAVSRRTMSCAIESPSPDSTSSFPSMHERFTYEHIPAPATTSLIITSLFIQ